MVGDAGVSAKGAVAARLLVASGAVNGQRQEHHADQQEGEVGGEGRKLSCGRPGRACERRQMDLMSSPLGPSVPRDG